jgi:hypothetical protein
VEREGHQGSFLGWSPVPGWRPARGRGGGWRWEGWGRGREVGVEVEVEVERPLTQINPYHKHQNWSFRPTSATTCIRLSLATISKFHTLKEYSSSFIASSKNFHPLYLLHLQQCPLNLVSISTVLSHVIIYFYFKSFAIACIYLWARATKLFINYL